MDHPGPERQRLEHGGHRRHPGGEQHRLAALEIADGLLERLPGGRSLGTRVGPLTAGVKVGGHHERWRERLSRLPFAAPRLDRDRLRPQSFLLTHGRSVVRISSSAMAGLDGRVIAIAGAAGGLGPTVARRLADDGATIAATDVHQERLDQLRSDLALPEDRFDGRTVDLLSEDATREWVSALTERFGRIDGLLHLVGGWKGGDPIATTPLSDYEWLHDLLVHTVQHTTRAFYEQLAASDHGRFVLVSSSQAQSPDGTNASYAATKAAAESWTLALADSLKDTNATANIIVVNAILTPRMREANPEKAFATFTSAEDLADAIRFVVGDSAAKMNGKRLELHP